MKREGGASRTLHSCLYSSPCCTEPVHGRRWFVDLASGRKNAVIGVIAVIAFGSCWLLGTCKM